MRQSHEELCESVVQHMTLAEALQDRRIAEAADHITRFLDGRRKVPWSDYQPRKTVLKLSEPPVHRVGSFVVEFSTSYMNGLSYTVGKDLGNNDVVTIATLPIEIHAGCAETKIAIRKAEYRAILFAQALQKHDKEMDGQFDQAPTESQ